MAITKTDVLLIAPGLSGLSDAQWTALIADAYAQLNASILGSKLDLVAKYLVAHFGTIVSQTSLASGVKAEKAGDVSIEYRDLTQASGLDSTAYGKEFQRLLRVYSVQLMVP